MGGVSEIYPPANEVNLGNALSNLSEGPTGSVSV